jgi:hypothetical protein
MASPQARIGTTGNWGCVGDPPPVAGNELTCCEPGDDARPTTTDWVPAAEARGLTPKSCAVPPKPVMGTPRLGTGLEPFAPAPLPFAPLPLAPAPRALAPLPLLPFVPLAPARLPVVPPDDRVPPVFPLVPVAPPVTRVPPVPVLQLLWLGWIVHPYGFGVAREWVEAKVVDVPTPSATTTDRAAIDPYLFRFTIIPPTNAATAASPRGIPRHHIALPLCPQPFFADVSTRSTPTAWSRQSEWPLPCRNCRTVAVSPNLPGNYGCKNGHECEPDHIDTDCQTGIVAFRMTNRAMQSRATRPTSWWYRREEALTDPIKLRLIPSSLEFSLETKRVGGQARRRNGATIFS